MKQPNNYQSGLHYSREFEKALLGACLISPAAVGMVTIKPEVFYDDGHRKVFMVMIDMYKKSTPIDCLTVWQQLIQSGIKIINGDNTSYFITRLTNGVVSDSHLKYWCNLLQQMYQKRISLVTIITGKKPSPTSWKTPAFSKFFLKYLTKEAIRHTRDKYGLKTILGTQQAVIRVENKEWVYLMHLIEPAYTWTCGTVYDSEYTRAECIKALPKTKLHLLDNKLIWK